MAKFYLLNITWKCQLNCHYCWMRKNITPNKELRDVPERTLDEWIAAIKRDKPDLIGLGGGEPLSVSWVLDLIRAFPDVKFAINTNGLNSDKMDELKRERIPNVVHINYSYHPDAAKRYAWYNDLYKQNMIALAQAGYPVTGSVVIADGYKEGTREIMDWACAVGAHITEIPICTTRPEIKELTHEGLVCDAGITHLFSDPSGQVWACQTCLNSPFWKSTCLGNWVDGTVDLDNKPEPCYLWCVERNVNSGTHESGDFFHVNARPM
jgi:hypothetical protein